MHGPSSNILHIDVAFGQKFKLKLDATCVRVQVGALPNEAELRDLARPKVHHYFVDESGDLALFGSGCRSLVLGSSGCSKTFMIGIAKISKPDVLHDELNDFRNYLISQEPYKSLMSVNDPNKTSKLFHARADHYSIRMKVLDFIAAKRGVSAMIAIRRKCVIQDELKTRSERGVRRGLSKTEEYAFYDDLVSRLTHGALHKAESNQFTFAQRGKNARTDAITKLIACSQSNFQEECRHAKQRPFSVLVSQPHAHGGLQVIDYLLWALQRGYERNDWDAYNIVKRLYAIIHDIDDLRTSEFGQKYGRRGGPFTPEITNALWQTTPRMNPEQQHEADVRLPESV